MTARLCPCGAELKPDEHPDPNCLAAVAAERLKTNASGRLAVADLMQARPLRCPDMVREPVPNGAPKIWEVVRDAELAKGRGDRPEEDRLLALAKKHLDLWVHINATVLKPAPEKIAEPAVAGAGSCVVCLNKTTGYWLNTAAGPRRLCTECMGRIARAIEGGLP